MEIMATYGEAADVAWKMGRIMLKYRPIAPKPVTGSTSSASAGPTEAKTGNGRGKRKGSIKEHGKRGRKSAKKIETNYSSNNNNNIISGLSCAPVVTLPLMPMTPERKEEESPAAATPSPTASEGHVARGVNWTAWQQGLLGSNVVVGAPRPVRPVGSWVTVECVTDMWRYGEAPAALETDTCPVFVSDDCDRVTWTNAAYKHMVVGSSEGGEEEMGVALMTRGLVPREGVTCFTCRVRVRCTCRGRGKVSMAAPCDVWRLADGKLAWRLDVKAALSLGLGC